MEIETKRDGEFWVGRDQGGKVVKLNFEKMNCHTIVIGQTGSGKSSTVARLLEELLLNTEAKVVILDLNADYMRLKEVNEETWKKEKLSNTLLKEYPFDEMGTFKEKWKTIVNKGFLYMTKIPVRDNNLFISWDKLSKKELRGLLGLDPFRDPEAVWLLDLLKRNSESKGGKWTLTKWREISKSVLKWARGHLPYGDPLGRFISITTSVPTAQRVAVALTEALDLDIWKKANDPVDVEEKLGLTGDPTQMSTKNLPRMTCINLASFSDIHTRLFTTRYILGRLWQAAENDRWRVITQCEKEERVPIFVIVDESHRLAPKEEVEEPMQASVLELFRQIAAEGRKYKLFLMLITQRPSKLHRDILSECENVCIMRLVNQSDQKLLETNFGFIDKTKLESVATFKEHQALFAGRWINDETINVGQVATRRTQFSG